jgi:hypothetical protein
VRQSLPADPVLSRLFRVASSGHAAGTRGLCQRHALQPFGDTVNWDLLPDVAIDRLDLVGCNPVFARVDEAME